MSENNSDVDSQFIIETLIEENRHLNENRMYLMATLRQFQAEFEAARNLWEAEKESILKKDE